MRKIKFRVWDKDYKQMHVCGENTHDRLVFEEDGNAYYYNLQNGCGNYGEESSYILMQYTGLKDRKSKEIFEGDIIKQTYHTYTGHVYDGSDMTFDGHHIGPVVIAARGVCMKNPLHYSEDTDETNPMNAYKQVAGYRSEVIGNIYEHPHLLGGGKADE